MNDYFDFYLEIGSYFLDVGSDLDFELTDLWMERMRIEILDNLPHIATDGKEYPSGTDFELYLYSGFYISHTEKSNCNFIRYAIFINDVGIQRLRHSIKILTAKCAERGRIWDSFHEYASFPLDEAMWEWPDLAKDDYKLYTPKMTWRFDTNQVVAEGATMYDVRIVVIVTWNYEGKDYSFVGYWYVTSVAFICQRLEAIDPYYRRFVLLSHAFSIEHLRKQLQEELAYLTTIHPTKRELCLKHHFEYDELPNFYER